MLTRKLAWTPAAGWNFDGAGAHADLVIYFGSREKFRHPGWYEALRERFPGAQLLGCSSASQIAGAEIVEDGIVGVALTFKSVRVRTGAVAIARLGESYGSGADLGRQLADPDLRGVLVLSDGLTVNGSELTRGISGEIGPGIPVSGGLAADGANFEETLVGLNRRPEKGWIAAVGFYGDAAQLATGSAGGWSAFGPRRRISKSDGNILYTLDDRPALELYERYLGPEEVDALPSSALLFPLNIFDPEHPEHSVVRTVLAVDRQHRSMTFAGDMPEGWVAELMRGNVDRLTLGAAEAARQLDPQGGELPADSLVLLVSCIGRRLLMGQRTIDEVEAVSEVVGPHATRLGFYSYGEICPHSVSGLGEMHNQTMTVTAISERP